jgi:hypothetical protein
MKSMKPGVFLSLLFILFLENPVLGANWIEYGQSKKGDVYSYNKSSVKNIKGDTKQFWERYDFANVIHNVKSTTVLREIDCRESKSRIISVIDYDVYSSMLHSNSNYDSEWQDISPDSRLETLRKIICE